MCISASWAHAQTVWSGAGSTSNFSNGNNWVGGVAPANDGTATIQFNYVALPQTVTFSTATSLQGIDFNFATNYFEQVNFVGTGPLTLGGGGMANLGGGGQAAFISVPMVLSSSQTWTSPSAFLYITSSIGETGGSQGLTISNGSLYDLTDHTTFSGGLTIANNGSLFLGSPQDTHYATVGTGALTLQTGSTIQAWNANGYIPNQVNLGDGVTVGPGLFGGTYFTLELGGQLKAEDASTTLTLHETADLILSGTLTAATSASYNFQGGRNLDIPLVDGGSRAVINGSFGAGVTGFNVSNTDVILAPLGDPVTSLGAIGPTGITVGGDFPGYLGFEGNYTQSGAVSGFISKYGATLGGSINGTLGFDTLSGATPNVFKDPVDLSKFISGQFVGLGSSTSAILDTAAVITPTGSGSYTPNSYVFGGGGGTLYVRSPLADGGTSSNLIMNGGDSPLTLYVQGGANYTGSTNVFGGVLIFDSPTNLTGPVMLYGGYVGYTPNAGFASASAFLDVVAPNTSTAVIGFDSASPSSPVSISDPISFSSYGYYALPFLGTSTTASIAGSIDLGPFSTYQFTGVKGGVLTVTSKLTGSDNSVVIGLPTPIESNGSVSTVILTNSLNDYGGGTTLNTGILKLAEGATLGNASGPLTVVPDTSISSGPSLEPLEGGGTEVVPNPITLNAFDGTNPSLNVGNPASSDLLTLNGVIWEASLNAGILGIQGPVLLGGANTYSGGTQFVGPGNGIAYVTNSASLGTGTVTMMANGSIVPQGTSVTVGNPISFDVYDSTLTLGSTGNVNTLVMNGVISNGQSYGSVVVDSNVIFGAVNTYTGPTTVNNAVLTLETGATLGTGPVQLYGGTLAYAGGDQTLTDLSGDATSVVALSGSSTLTLNYDSLYTYY
jgi:hypothetical protein